MGNQLVGVAPSQIFPVEHYLTDHPQLKYDLNLGSTRFFKVARAKSQEGLVVVKVFAIHDPTLPLATHIEQIEEIRSRLASAVNCLPFQKTILQDKAGFIIREYIKSSLYDRISTRPFLTAIQKKFVMFQLLYALHQCHKVGVCHGDIKLENVMVTSWNWILLTDFASFKPSFIPEDNPADFSYFFDTSRRRICYIAPERFHSSARLGTDSVLLEEGTMKGELTPAMDIFSVGCCLIELYNEGQPPFDLSQLLSYRINLYYPNKHLESIEDIEIRNLLAHMIQKDPSARHSAEVYLDEAKGKIFPEYFYSFLQSYMLMFSVAQPVMSADEKISRLSGDIDNVIEMLCEEGNGEGKKDGTEGLVIISTLVTSCVRALRQTTSKLQALRIMLQLSQHLAPDNILDRIIPYVMHLVHDSAPRVRIRAVSTLTQVLSYVKPVPPSDGNIFPEYLLPGLAPLAQDPVVLVRCAYASNLADLAETALRFIEECQPEQTTADNKLRRYETELEILQDTIQQSTTALLTESPNIVKITLVKNAITRLCVFFGKQKANDVLLSHLITFLNDKRDKHLRGAFFDCIVGVVSYIGIHSSPIITPLLQQGLTDLEEFIIVKAINAMRELILLRLVSKPSVYVLVSDCVCYLAHPNLWIRHAVAGLIAVVAKTLDPVDVQCRVSTTVSKSLLHPLRTIDKEYLVLNALMPCLSRTILDVVLKCQDIDQLFETLREKQKARDIKNKNVQYVPVPPSLKTVFRVLESENFENGAQDQLLMMSKHLLKIHKHRLMYHQSRNIIDLHDTNGRIELAHLNINVPTHFAVLRTEASKDYLDNAKRRMEKTPEGGLGMNVEWQHMFSSNASDQSTKVTATVENPVTQPCVEAEQSIQDKSYVEYRRAPCRVELRNVIIRKQEAYSESARGRELAEQAAWKSPLPPPGWRCRGTLVAHLHEHRGSINKLVPIPDSGKFASCSNDGMIRLWDCLKMEGRNIANRSRLIYNRQTGALTGLTLCEGGKSLAAVSNSGSVFVMRVETSSGKTPVQVVRQLDMQEDGSAVDINYLDSGSQSVLIYATMYGSLVGWDLRKPGSAFKLDNDLKHGVITSFCVDSEQWWSCVGTSSGYHTAWDLRFLLPVANCRHPHGYRVWKIVRHPTEPSCVLSAVQGNHEVSVWNMETLCRQTVLWGSTTPPLSKTQMNGHSASSLYAGRIDRNPFLFTGGTDMRLRYWDLAEPLKSHYVAPSALDTPSTVSIAYDSRIIDGMNVVHEVALKPRPGVEETSRSDDSKKIPGDEFRGRAEAPSPGHNDAITDIEMCQANQCFLLTASRNGVIKVWK